MGAICARGGTVAIHKVLIVDDARPDLMNLERIVSAAGYTTLTATNGVQAVEMSKAQLPDVILMDVNMDQMDGFAATRAPPPILCRLDCRRSPRSSRR
jgi:CheY-like chemotaxis protein